MTHRSRYDFLKLKISEKYYLNLEPLDYKKMYSPGIHRKMNIIKSFRFLLAKILKKGAGADPKYRLRLRNTEIYNNIFYSSTGSFYLLKKMYTSS